MVDQFLLYIGYDYTSTMPISLFLLSLGIDVVRFLTEIQIMGLDGVVKIAARARTKWRNRVILYSLCIYLILAQHLVIVINVDILNSCHGTYNRW